MSKERKIFKLNDSTIMGIIRALQHGLLTGTDISDHMRMMRFETMRDDEHTLVLTDEFLKQETANLKRLVDEALKHQDEAAEAAVEVASSDDDHYGTN